MLRRLFPLLLVLCISPSTARLRGLVSKASLPTREEAEVEARKFSLRKNELEAKLAEVDSPIHEDHEASVAVRKELRDVTSKMSFMVLIRQGFGECCRKLMDEYARIQDELEDVEDALLAEDIPQEDYISLRNDQHNFKKHLGWVVRTMGQKLARLQREKAAEL